MHIERREFLLTVGGAVALSVASPARPAAPGTPASAPGTGEGVIDAGPLGAFAADAVYDAHREEGFFIVRRDGRLFALSSICTHKGCKVRAQEDGAYLCKCHGSTFDRDGKVTKGPATRDLPRLAVAVDAARHVFVDPARQFEAGHFSPATGPQ